MAPSVTEESMATWCPKSQNRRPLMEELEPRLLFSADGLGVFVDPAIPELDTLSSPPPIIELVRIESTNAATASPSSPGNTKSNDRTGNELLGGDWDLEHQQGDIETEVAVSAAVQAEWEAVLAATSAIDDAYSVNEDTTPTMDWWDTNWTKRQKLTVDNSVQTENLADFAVLVKLNSDNIDYAQTQGNGRDLRFFDADGTALAHEIEEWNEAGDSYVWVSGAQIDSSSSTEFIWMYYGNASAENITNGKPVTEPGGPIFTPPPNLPGRDSDGYYLPGPDSLPGPINMQPGQPSFGGGTKGEVNPRVDTSGGYFKPGPDSLPSPIYMQPGKPGPLPDKGNGFKDLQPQSPGGGYHLMGQPEPGPVFNPPPALPGAPSSEGSVQIGPLGQKPGPVFTPPPNLPGPQSPGESWRTESNPHYVEPSLAGELTGHGTVTHRKLPCAPGPRAGTDARRWCGCRW